MKSLLRKTCGNNTAGLYLTQQRTTTMDHKPTAAHLDRLRTAERMMARYAEQSKEPVTVISDETLGAMAEADPTLSLD